MSGSAHRSGSGRERGRASVPARSALASAVLCIAGIVAVIAVIAVIAFTATIAHLLTTPRLSGASFDAAISPVTASWRPAGSQRGRIRRPHSCAPTTAPSRPR
jgi:hypothetical protein